MGHEATDTHTEQLGRLEEDVGEVQETLEQVKVDVGAMKATLVDFVGLGDGHREG